MPGGRKLERNNRETGTGLSGMEAERVPVFRHRAGHLRLPHGRLRHRVPHPRVAGEEALLIF